MRANKDDVTCLYLVHCRCTAMNATYDDTFTVQCWNCNEPIFLSDVLKERRVLVEGIPPSKWKVDEINPHVCPF